MRLFGLIGYPLTHSFSKTAGMNFFPLLPLMNLIRYCKHTRILQA